MKAIIVIAVVLAVSFAQLQIDYQQCAQDAFQFAQNAKKFYQFYENGDKNINDYIPLVESLVAEGKALFADCGIKEEMEQHLSVSAQCQTDIKSLANLCEKAYNDFADKNIYALVQDAVAVVKEGEQTLADCKSSAKLSQQVKANLPECAKDAVVFGQDLYAFVELIKNNGTGNIPEILTDVEKILEDAQNLIKDCGIPVNPEYLVSENKTACTKDIEDMAKLAAEAIKDYEAKNIIALVKVAAQIVKEANKTIDDCKSSLINFAIQLPGSDRINYEQCAKDAYSFVQDCYSLYEIVENGTATTEAIIQQINKTVVAAQATVDACGFNFTIEDYPPSNPGECATDVIQLAQLGLQAFNDATSGQWRAFTTDVISVLAQGGKTINECLQSNQTQIDQDNAALFNCIHSLNTFTTDIETFLGDIKSGAEFTALVGDANAVAQYFPEFLTTCGAAKLANEYSKYFPDQCFDDLTNVADSADAIYNARSNIWNLLRLLPAFANAAESSLADCPLLHKKL